MFCSVDPGESLLEADASRMCVLLVGLPEVRVLGVDDLPGEPRVVHIEQAGDRP